MKGNFEQVYKHVCDKQTCFYNPHTGVINPIHGYFVESPTYVSEHSLPANHEEFKGLVTSAFNFNTLEELWEMNVSLGFIVEDVKVRVALYHHYNNLHLVKASAKCFRKDHYYQAQYVNTELLYFKILLKRKS